MPNRMLRDCALASKKLSRVNAEAERLYWRLLMVADDFGRFEADPVVIKAKCFPRHRNVTDRSVKSAWKTLVEAGLMYEYTAHGDLLGQFAKWDQRVRAARSKHPGPECGQMTADDSQTRANDRPDVDVVEDVDGDDRRRRSSAAAPSIDDGFKAFWNVYPKHRKRGDAEKAWNAIRPNVALLGAILEAVAAQSKSHDWTKDGGRWIPYPATWLRAKQWEDTVDSPGADDTLPPLRLL